MHVPGLDGPGHGDPPAGEAAPGKYRTLLRGSARKRFILVAALVPPAIYLLYIWHYAVNAPFQDDWSISALVGPALHGRLTWSQLWLQHSVARIVVPNLFFVAFGFINHLNLKTVVFFSALIFVASFFLLLILFRRYTKRPLTFLRVFSLGIVWFSFMGVTNALWAFQLGWYLVLFFLFAMICFLFVGPRHRILALALAALVAIAASLSMLQGFLLWPVGLVCLLWVWRVERRRYGEVAVWLAIGLLTSYFYLRGYKSGVGCVPVGTDCSIRANASHVTDFTRFFLTLVANAVPVRVFYPRRAYIQLDLVWVQLLGAALCVAAAFVAVRSFRERRHDTRVPLPLLLMLFAVLFDLTIALGRSQEGARGALQGRYTMPSVLLLVGLVAYAGGRLPRPRALRPPGDSHGRLGVVGFAVLGMLVLSQGVVGTLYGLRVAQVERSTRLRGARTVANLDLISPLERACYARVYVWNNVYPPRFALVLTRNLTAISRRDHLTFFDPETLRNFRAQGLPPPVLRLRACLAGRRESVSNASP